MRIKKIASTSAAILIISAVIMMIMGTEGTAAVIKGNAMIAIPITALAAMWMTKAIGSIATKEGR